MMGGAEIRRWHLGACCVLVLLVVATFFPVVQGGWAPFDDDVQIYGNPHIASWSGENLGWMFTDTALTQRYTPLSWVAWTAIATTIGVKAWAFHLQALVLHALNAVLLYFLVYALVRRVPRFRGVEFWKVSLGALAGTAVWAVHPMRAEVVGWATQARYAEAFACAVGALLMYAAAVKGAKPEKSPWFWGAVVLYAASVLFYPSGITLFLLLPAMDVMLFERRPADAAGWRALLLEKAPFFAAALFAGVMTIYGRVTAGGMWGSAATLEQFGLIDRVMQALCVPVFYAWKPFDPAHASHLYTQLAEFHAGSAAGVMAVVVLLLVTAGAIAIRRRYPMVTLLWFAHLVLLLPFGGYFEHPYLLGDRYAYLEGALVALIIGAAVVLLQEAPRIALVMRRVVMICVAVVVGALAAVAHGQSRLWHDGVTLMQATIAGLSPDDPYRVNLYWELGKAYLDQRQFQQAMDASGETLKYAPENRFALRVEVQALIGLAREQLRAGNEEAYRALNVRAAETSDRLAAVDASSENFRVSGLLYQRGGRLDLAQTRLAEAIEKDPGDPNLRLRLGEVLAAQGKREDAVRALDAAVKMAPGLEAQRDEIMRAWSAHAGSASKPE